MMMGPQGGQQPGGGQPPLDLSGLPPEVLYALIELLGGGGMEAEQAPPGAQFQGQPGVPGELEAILRFLQQQGPEGRMQMSGAQFPDMVNRGQWGNVEPGR